MGVSKPCIQQTQNTYSSMMHIRNNCKQLVYLKNFNKFPKVDIEQEGSSTTMDLSFNNQKIIRKLPLLENKKYYSMNI